MNIWMIVAAYLVIVNIVAFAMYGMDKRKAKQGKWRTKESTLLGVCAIGGSIGAILGMQIFRHKTKHPQFVYGVPAMFVVHLIIAGFVVKHFFM